jgi:hypothetical protein
LILAPPAGLPDCPFSQPIAHHPNCNNYHNVVIVALIHSV